MSSFARYLLLGLMLPLFACDADEVAKQCVAADLVGQCPVGSNPVLGAAASEGCDGKFDGQLVSTDASVTGQCAASGSCEFLCQFQIPCTCGVVSITKEEIICAECPDQVCGDSRCEGTERAGCEADQSGCFACPEDCGGPTCGDGDCTGNESPDNCPQDCARACDPGAKECLGTLARVCRADGAEWDAFNCADIGLVCGGGECVAPNICGNKVCDGTETHDSCPSDCGTVCQPSGTRCSGNTLYTCNGTGSEETPTDCAADGEVCAAGACRPADICGNLRCEAGESESCPADCASECGNRVCENGETNSCPGDCVVCGDRVCGFGELQTCPQDCGICIPSERQCLGRTLRVCNANGTAFDDFECAAFDQVCAAGNCVEPNVCGNGACEIGEDESSCPDDCAVICGDGQCTGGETFTSCSPDCEPTCGDDSCQGTEVRATCPDDCLETCGNNVCDPAEDRDNCPRDCGYCGDGTCDDGFESGSATPPANQVTCLADCVVSGCEVDGDCNDGISCTPGKCTNKVCSYSTDDALCPFGEKCIKFNGCCPDADGDGFADAACGGSDCNDDDPLTYPGALEVCGGGDRNCNGYHRPSLKPGKKVTNTPSYKKRLTMVSDGSRFWAAWLGTPEQSKELQYARIGLDGNLIGEVGHLAQVVPNDEQPAIAWNPVTQRLGVAYGIASIGRFLTLDSEGGPSTSFAELLGTSDNTRALDLRMGVVDGHYVVSTYGHFNCGAGGNTRCDVGWYDVADDFTVTQPWGAVPAAWDFVTLGDQLVGYSNYNDNWSAVAPGGKLYKARAGENNYVAVDIAPPSADGVCRLDHDGEALVLVCQYYGAIGTLSDGGKVYYHRLAANGAALSTEIIAGVNIAEPRDIAVAPDGLRANDDAKIGIIMQEPAGNLVFAVRDIDGSAVVEPGFVATGATIANPHVFWDGDGFVLFWLEKSGDLEQLYRSDVSCE